MLVIVMWQICPHSQIKPLVGILCHFHFQNFWQSLRSFLGCLNLPLWFLPTPFQWGDLESTGMMIFLCVVLFACSFVVCPLLGSFCSGFFFFWISVNYEPKLVWDIILTKHCTFTANGCHRYRKAIGTPERSQVILEQRSPKFFAS